MAAELPCVACSWTCKLQKSCSYESHVKLFYGASDRGAWSLGSKLVLKEQSDSPPSFEATNIHFLKKQTTTPLPAVVEDWNDEDGRYFIITKRIPGEPLSAAWGTMTAAEKGRVAKQTADFLLQLRQLRSPKMQSLGGQPIYSSFLFPGGYGVPHGPLSSDDELWQEMTKSWKGMPERVRQLLRERMGPATPYTFTHGDLTNVKIIVRDGNLAGIIDWDSSGYFPVWWEFACAGISLGDEDREWKTLLRKYMPEYTEALHFLSDVFTPKNYPNLNERGQVLLGDLEQS